jgi:hypothetical protein
VAITAVESTPVPASHTCPHCGTRVLPDQRYCLACGRPCSPVRLAFLDVLRAEYAQPGNGGSASGVAPTQVLATSGAVLPPADPVGYAAAIYVPPGDQSGVIGWLRRYAGLLGLLSVLLLAGLIGLLVGHWVTAPGKQGPQEVKVDYLNGAPATAGTAAGAASTSAPTKSTPAGSSTPAKSSAAPAASSHQSQGEEEKEASEEEHKAPSLPPPVHQSTNSQNKFESTTGKKHEEEAKKREEEHPGAPEGTG